MKEFGGLFKIPKFEPKEWSEYTHEEKVRFFERNKTFFPALDRINPHSLINELLEEKQNELVQKIQKGVDSYKCPENKDHKRIGVGLSKIPEEERMRLIFFCVDCAPEGWDNLWDSEEPIFKEIWGKK